ncbi:hypothetical protein PENANT_c004G02203 [Penicillium antarcticum]|uniref:RDRP core domain-containing protein n=1 Tax=Penicillium antarcticum TaxID=416450 RepID=A0A1V6QG95_9EURO|nr:uncharacterized protein N7508_002311 [Penicillium antarcticum]KAJ5317803.1 hypothetical protein N7508_002311 [Penicillium antarcticum]OQD88228.1 hypothetical protein PENANT_c004G02203 [Penicillium antarcticum]
MNQTPTTPQRQKQSFTDYIKSLNKDFALEIPVPGIESPSSRERNTTPPWQIYKRLHPLFYKGYANGLVVDLREWVVGQSSPAPVSTEGFGQGRGLNRFQIQNQDQGSTLGKNSASARTNARMRVEPPDLSHSVSISLSISDSVRADRMRYLLKLIEDEEYMIMNGRVDTTTPTRNSSTSPSTSTSTSTSMTSHQRQHQYQNQNPHQSTNRNPSHAKAHAGNKRLAENPPMTSVGLSPKKKRRFSVDCDTPFGDNDNDEFEDFDHDAEELFHAAPNSPIKASPFLPVGQSPLGKNEDGAFPSPGGATSFKLSGHANSDQSPVKRAISFTSPVKNQGSFPFSAKSPASFTSPTKQQGRVQPPASITASQPAGDSNFVQSPGNKPVGFSSPSKPQEGSMSPTKSKGAPRSPTKAPTKTPTKIPTKSPKVAKSPPQLPMRQMDLRSFGFGFKKPVSGDPPVQDGSEFKKPTLLDRHTAASDKPKGDNMIQSVNTSSSDTDSSIQDSRHTSMDLSFDTVVMEIAEPMDTQSTYSDSVVGYMISDEMNRSMDAATSMMVNYDPAETKYLLQKDLISELLSDGPFTVEHSLPGTVPLRFRYELDRVGRAWGVPLNRMLVGDRLPFNSQDEFWAWVSGHSQRGNRPLPEKSSSRAWDAAVGDFKTKKLSEVVVLSGDMEWCEESEPGIFKLTLNPLKSEKTCRFHRRFGSDRFLSVTVPAPTRPPAHQRRASYPSVLRESIAAWLTRNDHQCLGRTWRAFYVEEVKTKKKSKSEPKFRVELFAVDGEDFDRGCQLPPQIAPPRQPSDKHTRMGVDALLEWHMPKAANDNQTNCKLFQRLSLGLSKTFVTVTLKTTQVLRLRDCPGSTVMNDGCALMSRPLANQICDRLGITSATPSCFQGRIAGAKGLWMVDRHQSSITSMNNDDIWIQISDSQLKIHPHPEDWVGLVDDEKLTFEVVNWAQPLHPVDLNIQLLSILEYGGHVKEYIAKLTCDGVQALYDDFFQVLQSNSPVLCRALLQKLRTSGDNSTSKLRRLEQWMMNDAETIIRLSEAGFEPQTFYPLRVKIRKYLKWLLERQLEELKIHVPLSTYAYCIADPYGVLNAGEVHFGFSNNWRDPQGQFEDNLLEGVDVLVGRLPAHYPSDIQRRKAVWKPELRHFKDVIVFPTKGDIPLAHMLSGGDYDGDTPWVCWDPMIVQNFHNSPLPSQEFPAEHYGLSKESVQMAELESTDDFLESSFVFNLTMSNLGRCTVEHEKLAYDESIDSRKAKELACLLSYLVDGRKGGVHLSEQAWQEYRKTISPKQRALPAYRNSERKSNPSNIVDYLKFEVADRELRTILSRLNDAFPESKIHNDRDEDLTRPWNTVLEVTENSPPPEESPPGSVDLRKLTGEIQLSIDKLYRQWSQGHSASNAEFSAISRQAAECASALPPPEGSHPLLHTWQNSRSEWSQVLASYAYLRYPRSGFVMHAFGETLCQIKASGSASRLITNDVLACYRVNQKMVAHLTVNDLPDHNNSDGDEYEGGEAVEALIAVDQGAPADFYDDWDDGMSVE